MIYGSICSGIEACSLAWEPLGWRPAFFSEIEKAPRAVLAHRWPKVPLHGDFTTIQRNDYETIELLAAGTPCQDFSVAGLRAGLAGDRGSLTIEFVLLLKRLLPTWFAFENVPGILSADEGRAFGIFLGALARCGYGFAYRILDAQYFGIPQRRRRVFVVGYLGDWRPPAAVLFERESLRWNSAPRREEGEGIACDIAPYLDASGGEYPVIIFDCKASGSRGFGYSDARASTLRGMVGKKSNGGGHLAVASTSAVRRLTPRECERLMGMPDDHTLVPYAGRMMADGPRYQMIGNSMAVPCMRWLGQRIDLVAGLMKK